MNPPRSIGFTILARKSVGAEAKIIKAGTGSVLEGVWRRGVPTGPGVEQKWAWRRIHGHVKSKVGTFKEPVEKIFVMDVVEAAMVRDQIHEVTNISWERLLIPDDKIWSFKISSNNHKRIHESSLMSIFCKNAKIEERRRESAKSFSILKSYVFNSNRYCWRIHSYSIFENDHFINYLH